jgi:hypothetical protein
MCAGEMDEEEGWITVENLASVCFFPSSFFLCLFADI